MATLAVLEGNGHDTVSRRRRVGRFGKPGAVKNNYKTASLNPWQKRRVGHLRSDGTYAPLSGSLWSKIGNVAKSAGKLAVAPVTTVYSVTKSAAKATGHAVLHPSLTNISKIVTAPTTRLVNETKTNVREAGHGIAEAGRATKIVANVGYRVTKRLIRKMAAKVLLKGDVLLGDDGLAKYPKNAAKGVLIPVATAAVVANTVTAPFSPAVPVIVNTVIDELYSAIEKKIKRGLSPERAKQEISDALNSDDDDAADRGLEVGGGMLPWVIGGGAVLALIIFMRRR
jgi:hypothetical protein